MKTKLKARKCRNCRGLFLPSSSLHVACSMQCAIALAKGQTKKRLQAEEKQARARQREARARVKTRAEYLREAQAVVNRYVRLRDADQGCISCDKPAAWSGQWHCSHFRSVGSAPHLRFNLWNMHKGCSICNNHLSGNIMGYRPRLAARIGEARVLELEADQDPAKHSIEYLQRLKRVFAKRCRLIEKRRAALG